MRRVACTLFLGLITVVSTALPAACKKPGENCTQTSDCIPDSLVCASGTCRNPEAKIAEPGADCTSTECAKPWLYYCNLVGTTTCIKRAQQGDACTHQGRSCYGKYVCNKNVCVLRFTVGDGEAADTLHACKTGLRYNSATKKCEIPSSTSTSHCHWKRGGFLGCNGTCEVKNCDEEERTYKEVDAVYGYDLGRLIRAQVALDHCKLGQQCVSPVGGACSHSIGPSLQSSDSAGNWLNHKSKLTRRLMKKEEEGDRSMHPTGTPVRRCQPGNVCVSGSCIRQEVGSPCSSGCYSDLKGLYCTGNGQCAARIQDGGTCTSGNVNQCGVGSKCGGVSGDLKCIPLFSLKAGDQTIEAANCQLGLVVKGGVCAVPTNRNDCNSATGVFCGNVCHQPPCNNEARAFDSQVGSSDLFTAAEAELWAASGMAAEKCYGDFKGVPSMWTYTPLHPATLGPSSTGVALSIRKSLLFAPLLILLVCL